MKAIKYLSILVLSLIATSCMNDFDDPLFNEPPFGNNEIGEATHTIAQLKEKYAKESHGLNFSPWRYFFNYLSLEYPNTLLLRIR